MRYRCEAMGHSNQIEIASEGIATEKLVIFVKTCQNQKMHIVYDAQEIKILTLIKKFHF